MAENAERAVRLGAQLYEARDTSRLLLGKRYAEFMEVYQRGLKMLMETRGIDALQAAIFLCKKADSAEEGIFILSAAVELIEPSGEVAHG